MRYLFLALLLAADPASATVDVEGKTVTGDVTITGGGDSSIASGAVVNDDVNASAAIDHSKLGAITAGRVLMGNVSNVPTATAITGDVTITSSGVTAIGAGKVTEAMQAPQGIGFNVSRVAIGLFDPSANPGERTVGDHAIPSMTLPAKAILIGICVDIVTTFTSGTDAAALFYGLEAAADFGAHGLSNLVAGVPKCIRPNEVIKSTVSRTLSIQVYEEALTAGKMYVFAEYLQGF